jgi:DNA-binding MarR family transcriptional regulator
MSSASPSLAYDLRVALGRLVRRVRSVEPTHGATWSQFSILSRLERIGGTTAATLAAEEGVRPQSMGASLDALEAERLVRRDPDPADRRQVIVSISEAGRQLLLSKRASREQWLTKVISSRLSREEQTILKEAVRLLERLAEE